MREIKFRVWDKQRNVMEDCIEVNPFHIGDCDRRRWNRNEVDLMQFTGNHDKNKKEIYEGDRFQKGKSIGTIEYQIDSFIIDWDEPNEDRWNEHLRHHASNGEIIGNIHERSGL